MRTLLLDALNGKKTNTTPIWIMRQAGRYLPEYRKTRGQFSDFMAMCRHAEACCEVALQPLDRFDLDASIVFSDILTIPEAMGMDLKFTPGQGPVFSNPIRSEKAVDSLDSKFALEKLEYVMNAVKTTKKAINERVPLIGFSGSPWTLAAYMIEGQGSKQFIELRKMMYAAPNSLHRLLNKLTEITQHYLSWQITSGADVVMIFDTWGGLLSDNTYQEFSLNYMQKIIKEVKRKHPKTPIILFTKGGGLWLDKIANAGCDASGIDWKININTARNIVKNQITLQGNIDPAALYGSPQSIKNLVEQTVKSQSQTSKYIFNLGHGIYPDINPEHVKIMVDAVREFGEKNTR